MLYQQSTFSSAPYRVITISALNASAKIDLLAKKEREIPFGELSNLETFYETSSFGEDLQVTPDGFQVTISSRSRVSN